jgi:hypothetical protein
LGIIGQPSAYDWLKCSCLVTKENTVGLGYGLLVQRPLWAKLYHSNTEVGLGQIYFNLIRKRWTLLCKQWRGAIERVYLKQVININSDWFRKVALIHFYLFFDSTNICWVPNEYQMHPKCWQHKIFAWFFLPAQ